MKPRVLKKTLLTLGILIVGNSLSYAAVNPFYSPIDRYEKLEEKLEKAENKKETQGQKEQDSLLTIEIVGVIKIGRLKLLEVRQGNQIKFYKEGDFIDGWRVKKVDFNQVILVRGKEKQIIPIN
jgi:hypothetical protein